MSIVLVLILAVIIWICLKFWLNIYRFKREIERNLGGGQQQEPFGGFNPFAQNRTQQQARPQHTARDTASEYAEFEDVAGPAPQQPHSTPHTHTPPESQIVDADFEEVK